MTMHSRRTFLKHSLLGGVALATPTLSVLGNPLFGIPAGATLKISLAQWSLHRALEKGEIRAEDFPVLAKKEFGIGAVEYVNQFYTDKAKVGAFWQDLRRRAQSEGVENVLIMVDGEGDLGDPQEKKRVEAVANHQKWLEAAQLLGCHSIRVNAFGSGGKAALTDGLGRLAEEGAAAGISVLVENHGMHTSNAAFMVEILEAVDSPFLGTLPDFGNWCLNKPWGSTQDGECTQSYDPVRGLEELLPFARGVSAKSYDFDADGNETLLPYRVLLEKVKASEFSGYIGIEYEGHRLSEYDGVRATKALLEKVWSTLP
jgi:sugar phosphate isomerase/epimerase